MKTITKAAAVAVLTAGAVMAPVSAQAFAAPLNGRVSAAPAVHLPGRDHNPFVFRHDRGPGYYRHIGDLHRYRGGRGLWRRFGHRLRSCDRLAVWDRDCYADWPYTDEAYGWDCYNDWRL